VRPLEGAFARFGPPELRRPDSASTYKEALHEAKPHLRLRECGLKVPDGFVSYSYNACKKALDTVEK